MKRLLLIAALFLLSGTYAANKTPRFYKADSDSIRFSGRAMNNSDGSLSFDWSGSHFSFRFEGKSCSMRVSDTKRNYYNIFVDGKLYGKATTEGAPSTILLAEKLEHGPHSITVQKRTEAEQGRTTLYGIEIDGNLLALPPASPRVIEFIGDSHTCGYGTEGKSPKEPFTPETENCDLAWGCITARYFDADYILIAHSGQGIVRNWGDKNEVSEINMCTRMTRTFDMTEAPQWEFQRYKPDIVVIKLGTNDFSPPITPSKEAFDPAFREMYGNLRAKYGNVPILYLVPPGSEPFYHHTQAIKKELNDPNLHCIMHFDAVHNMHEDLGAGYHPNYRGQRKMAAAVIPYIATITGWEMPIKAIE